MHSSIGCQFHNPTAVSFDRLRKRHTKQEGGLVDVMMLIAIVCQHQACVTKPAVRDQIPENADAARLEHRRQREIYRVVEPASGKSPETVAMRDLISTESTNARRFSSIAPRTTKASWAYQENIAGVLTMHVWLLDLTYPFNNAIQSLY